MTQDKPLVVAAGTKIVCENGHHVFTIAVNIFRGDAFPSASMIERADWFKPAPGKPMGRCGICGAAFNRATGHGPYDSGQVHTQFGWLPDPEHTERLAANRGKR